MTTPNGDVSLMCGTGMHDHCPGEIRPLFGPPPRPCQCDHCQHTEVTP